MTEYNTHAAIVAQLEAENAALRQANLDCVAHFEVVKAERDELLEALREAEYALDYASDMTKPEGLSGCDCPICFVSVKVRAVIAKAPGETP